MTGCWFAAVVGLVNVVAIVIVIVICDISVSCWTLRATDAFGKLCRNIKATVVKQRNDFDLFKLSLLP